MASGEVDDSRKETEEKNRKISVHCRAREAAAIADFCGSRSSQTILPYAVRVLEAVRREEEKKVWATEKLCGRVFRRRFSATSSPSNLLRPAPASERLPKSESFAHLGTPVEFLPLKLMTFVGTAGDPRLKRSNWKAAGTH